MSRYVVAFEDGGIETIVAVDSDLEMARAWRGRDPGFKVYELVEVPDESMQGPDEPPGIRVVCPRCGRIDWASWDKPSVFKLVTPWNGESAMIACPCGTGIEVTIK